MTRTKLFLLVLMVCLTTSLWAQVPNPQLPPSCIYKGTYNAGEPLPLSQGVQWGPAPGFPGGWTQPYWYYMYTCPNARPCPSCCPSCSGGHPINLATGNTYITQDDISVPGLGGGLTLSRTWNSNSTGGGSMFGLGWRSTYEESISLTPDGYIAYSRGNGDNWTFGFEQSVYPPTTYLPMVPANSGHSLVWDGTYWTVTFKSGEKRVFAGPASTSPAPGSLLAIIDRNGNRTQLVYDSFGRLTTVIDPASRTLTFSYNGLVTGITSSVGVSLSYAYDNFGRLVQVTKPDQTTVSFQYDSGSHITAVLDSQGKLLESHTYDILGRGTSSSRALGADALTVSYP